MKVLVISRVVWSKSNSFGNTYDNLLGGNPEFEVANIYCASGTPNTSVADQFFCISEKMIVDRLLKRSNVCGKRVNVRSKGEIDETTKNLVIADIAKKNKLQIMYWARDLLWGTNVWKSKELRDFLDEFRPDIIFAPLYYSIYMNNVRHYIKEYTNAPIVSFVSDDVYTLKQFSLSPLFWINRFLIRKKVYQSVVESKKLFVISKEQKEEYDYLFGIDSSILYKGAQLKIANENSINSPIRMVYMGNLGVGRWKTLIEIGKAVQIFNKEEDKFCLDVYSMSTLSHRTKRLFDRYGVCFKGKIDGDMVPKVLQEYDILIHCEAFALKERLQVRLSFSTKIVDYLAQQKCIFAVGPDSIASIKYLLRQEAALVASSKKEIFLRLKEIVLDTNLINIYAQKAGACAKRNHDLKDIRKNIYRAFIEIQGNCDEGYSN